MRLDDFDNNPFAHLKRKTEASLAVGDFVVVVRTSSIPAQYLGNYGRIIEKRADGKVRVEFGAKIGAIGSLFHIGRERDLKKVGESLETGLPDEK